MDLRARLRRWAHAHPRVLVVETPGYRTLRWAVEAAVDDRGWEIALSPAGTDVLIVVGEPDLALAEAADLVWSQVPRPHSRVSILEPALVNDALDAAWLRLTTPPAWANDSAVVSMKDPLAAAHKGQNFGAYAGGGPGGHAGHLIDVGGDASHELTGASGHASAPGDGEHAGHVMDTGGHAGREKDTGRHAVDGMRGASDHAGASHDGEHADHFMDMDMGEPAGHDMDIGEPAGHDMGGHGMHHGGVIAGLPMAQTAQDRDGLDLDLLSVSLGPILPGWPPGLVLRTRLQGDVLTDVGLSWTSGAQSASTRSDAPGPELTALDRLARFLMVAGWARAARRARRIRADLTSNDPEVLSSAQDSARRLAKQVRRSRVLAWSVRGVGSMQGTDVLGRVHRWCDSVAQPTGAAPAVPIPLADLADALNGTELAAARLIVASVELDRTAAPHATPVAGV